MDGEERNIPDEGKDIKRKTARNVLSTHKVDLI